MTQRLQYSSKNHLGINKVLPLLNLHFSYFFSTTSSFYYVETSDIDGEKVHKWMESIISSLGEKENTLLNKV